LSVKYRSRRVLGQYECPLPIADSRGKGRCHRFTLGLAYCNLPTTRGESIGRFRGLLPQGGFVPVVCGTTGSHPDHTLDAELAVAGALEALGFTPEIMEVGLDLALIERLPLRRPLVIFNLVDAIDGDGRLAPRVPARLDALGTTYTGCSTSALLATLSKVGTKLKLARAGLPTPEWSTDRQGLILKRA